MRWMIALSLLALGACGQSEEERRAADEADVAAVKAAQNRLPPLKAITPERLEESNIARIDASGAGCSVQPSTDDPLPLLVAVGSFGWIKRDGELVKLAADTGSERRPAYTWSRYTGRDLTLRIEDAPGEAVPDGDEGVSKPVVLTVRDAWDRVIYQGNARQVCSS